MFKRVEWLEFQMRRGRYERLPLVLLIFLAFESYYQLCTLLGYRPRRVLLDSTPESLRAIPPGKQVLMVWPRLPLSIRVLERVWPYAYGAHAELVPHTPEAEAEARAAGRRAEVMRTYPCELRQGESFR
jgi:hypothetical protein